MVEMSLPQVFILISTLGLSEHGAALFHFVVIHFYAQLWGFFLSKLNSNQLWPQALPVDAPTHL